MKKKRLAKFLAAAGISSRRKCEELIFAGKVKVNGAVTLLPQTLVDENDKVELDNKSISEEEQKVYYMLNKPNGYLCASTNERGGKLVIDLFEGVDERLFTIGRLDRDTLGLLLVTNDGDFANKVIHPSANIHKEYVVKTGKDITDEHLKMIAAGTRVEGTFVTPIKITKIRKGTVKIVVSDGKKREVRCLIESAGLEVKELKRTRIGGLHLGTLPTGMWRAMTDREKEMIFE